MTMKENSHSEVNRFWESFEVFDRHHWISTQFKGRGDLEFSGLLRFKGEWTGSLSSQEKDSHLFVMRGAVIRGRLRVEEISVEGLLEDVDVEAERFTALAGACIRGHIKARIIVVEDGAILQGQIQVLK